MTLSAILFSLVKYELLDIKPPKNVVDLLNDKILENLYEISKAHDIANIVGAAVVRLNVGNDDIKNKFNMQQMIAIYRYERSEYEMRQIAGFLSENNIEFIPLKGAVLRKFYPEPWMRTSCDIDILIHKKDLDRTKEMLIQKMKYKLHLIGSHDVDFYTPSDVHVELHYSLIEDSVVTRADTPLNMVWEVAQPAKELPLMYEMSKEMFYYYHIAHMVKHFLIGGCGIRPFIDLFVINKKFNLDEDRKTKLLKQGGLLKFAQQADELLKVWFDGNTHTNLTQNMHNYIFSGGVYGTVGNRVTIQQTKKGGRLKYALFRIWLPFNKIRFQFPVLNKHKWLLPVCQIRRWFRLLFCGGLRKSRREFLASSNITQEKADDMKFLIDQLEL